MVTKKVIHLLFNGILFLTSLWIVKESYELSLGYLHDPGPGSLSFFAGLLMGVLCLINLRTSLKSSDLKVPAFLGIQSIKQLGWTIIFIGMTIYLLEILGYVLTMTIFMICILTFVCQQTWKKIIIITVCTVAGTYTIFWLLQTQLPVGPFGF